MNERRELALSTRRDFLRRSALGAAALGLAACTPAVPTASGAPAAGASATGPRSGRITSKASDCSLPYQVWRPYLGLPSPNPLGAVKPGDELTALGGTGPFKWNGVSGDGVVSLKGNADYAWASDLFGNKKG